MDIQPVFNDYKVVIYMCSYSSKNEGQWSQAIKKAAKVAFENNLHYHEAMKAYLSKRKSSVCEVAYHILPEMKQSVSSSAFC